MLIKCSNCQKDNDNTSKFCASCGAPIASPFNNKGNLKDGFILKQRYKILKFIASGGMGNIYKASDLRLKNNVAIKEMIDKFTNPKDKAGAEEQFKTEASLLRKLSHPNLPAVIDYFSIYGRHYLVMDFVEGEDLSKVIEKNPQGLPEDTVKNYAIQLADALSYLHNQKPNPVIYRDMKPQNIMLTPQNNLKLIDFGIARHFVIGTKGTAIGTPGYAPPEQYKGNVEPRSDIFALGATLHHLLTGINPETIPLNFHNNPIRKLKPYISIHLENIVSKMEILNSCSMNSVIVKMNY